MNSSRSAVHSGTLLHTLYVANDNDFVPGTAGPNQFFVFSFQDGDLPGFVQQFAPGVPEPATWAMMMAGFGLVGASLRRRVRRVAVAYA